MSPDSGSGPLQVCDACGLWSALVCLLLYVVNTGSSRTGIIYRSLPMRIRSESVNGILKVAQKIDKKYVSITAIYTEWHELSYSHIEPAPHHHHRAGSRHCIHSFIHSFIHSYLYLVEGRKWNRMDGQKHTYICSVRNPDEEEEEDEEGNGLESLEVWKPASTEVGRLYNIISSNNAYLPIYLSFHTRPVPSRTRPTGRMPYIHTYIHTYIYRPIN